MGRQSHKAIERILKIGSMTEPEAKAFIISEKRVEPEEGSAGSLERAGSANALIMREKALRDIKAVHTRWYHRGEITAEQAVIEMEAITVSVWQREHSPNDPSSATRPDGGRGAQQDERKTP